MNFKPNWDSGDTIFSLSVSSNEKFCPSWNGVPVIIIHNSWLVTV